MRWRIATYAAALVVLVSMTVAKPGHVTEERREYYQKTSKVIDTPIQYYTTGTGSYSSSNGALSSTWARSHMDEVRKMAEKLKSEYNLRASGYYARHGFSSGSAFDYPSFTGKSKEELDVLTRDMTEKVIADMKSGKLVYSQISQPNWFENQAAEQLEALSHRQEQQSQNYENQDLQQQTQEVFGAEGLQKAQQQGSGGYHKTTEKKHYEYTSSHHGGYQPVPTYASESENLNQHEEKSSVVYPTTVTIIGGSRYVDRKNCSASSAIGSRTPYFRTQSNIDRRTQENERNMPAVVGHSQSTHDIQDSSYHKQQDKTAVPVYPGSYFTDDQYDAQYSQTHDGQIPTQSQIHGQSSEVRESSQSNRQYTIPVTGSQTTSSSSTIVQERDHHRVPMVVPKQQTISSSSESYSQSGTQKQIPITYPTGSSSSHRESSSYESVREKQVPRPIATSSHHSIYKHLQQESESVPNYKPEVTVDSQVMETMSQQANRYYPQRTSTFVHAAESEHEEEDRQVQQSVVIPDLTFTVHEQESREDVRNQQVQPIKPTTSTSQQTITDERQQSSVHYRPNYPAYGSHTNRNATQYHQTHHSRYPQQQTTGTNYENREEYYTEEGQQQVPIFGHTSQTTEETNKTEQYRGRTHETPIVIGGETYREDQDEYYSEDKQKQVPVQGYETNYEQNRTEEYTGHRDKPVYSGGSSQVTETEDHDRESHQYQYPGPQSTQTASDTEDSYWSRHHSRPGSIPIQSGSETETEYQESSHTRYPQGVATSQTTLDEETSGVNIHRRPGQPGYATTSQFNETSSTSTSGSAEETRHPIVITDSQHTILESQNDNQVEQRPGYGELEIDTERNGTSLEIRGEGHYSSGSEYNREISGTHYDQENEQRRPQGGIGTEETQYGSQVNRVISSGPGTIGYITHQLTIELQEEELRRQQEERRRQQLISTGIFKESSLNRSIYGDAANGNIQINLEQNGIYDGDDKPRNGTIDTTQYEPMPDQTSTSASGKPPKKIVSKDRGDQPPQHFEDDYDMGEAEPGIGYYPSEPEIRNQNAEPNTPRYPPPYVAHLAPLKVDNDKDLAGQNQETTGDNWPATADDTDVQRTYHRKKTTITSTIPVLLSPSGQVIEASGASFASDTQQRESQGSESLQSQIASSDASYHDGSLASGSLTQQQETSNSYGSGSSGAYESSSSSHQSGGRGGTYGSSSYGSQIQYNGGSSGGSDSNRSRYATGSSSSSTSYQDGGSFSQASAYGHQRDSSENQGQLQIGALEIDGGQQTEDLPQQFVDIGQESEDLQQELEGLAQREELQAHESYSSHSSGGSQVSHHQEREADQPASSSHSHGSYSSHSSSSSSSSSAADIEEAPATVEEVQAEQVITEKPGFWKKVGDKAKNLFG